MQTKRRRWTPEEDAIVLDIKNSTIKSTRFKKICGAKRVLKGRTAGAIAQRMYKVSTQQIVESKGAKTAFKVKVEKDHIKIYFM